jgi:hypothetical protein
MSDRSQLWKTIGRLIFAMDRPSGFSEEPDQTSQDAMALAVCESPGRKEILFLVP